MQEFEAQRAQGFPPHPKVECLLNIALEHFLPSHPENKSVVAESGEVEQTRMMVFVTFRDCVEEVVQALNAYHPTIRASRFIGQAKNKEGMKGIDQAGQSEVSDSESSIYYLISLSKVLRQFKAGIFNVLVSTSIGEEGLDIGKVDRIVCYDSSKTPIRMVNIVSF